MKARGAVVLVALGAAACGPTLPNFDGAFPDAPETFADASDDTEVINDFESGPLSCVDQGNHCNSNEDCCMNMCSLGVHKCM